MVLTCAACGQKNRVNPGKLPSTGTCGKCSAALGPLDKPVDVDIATFDAVVNGTALPVLVDFWAPWCGPCLRAAPEVARAAAQLAGKAVVLKVNTEQYPAISQRFGIRGIPYFAVFRNGERVAEQTGMVNAGRLVALVP